MKTVFGWTFTINPGTPKEYLPSTSSHPNHSEQNTSFCLAQRICTIAENTAANLSKYNFPVLLIKQGFQKAFSIPQKDLRKLKKLSNKNILPFITTFNPNNHNIYSTIKSLVNCLKNNSVSSFHNIKLIESKHQPPNLKRL